MAISETQLSTWAKQGSIDLSSRTYASVRSALEHSTNSPISHLISSGVINIRLQGSYANDTNIRGDSDVDVIVEYTNTFHSNKHELPPQDLYVHEQTYSVASYQWKDLRGDVITALQKYFGNDTVDTTGNKSLKILKNSNRLRSDVVPVVSYRRYAYFKDGTNHEKEKGVAFYHMTTKQEIINYPDYHKDNGVTKHANTTEWFKPTVRIFKNMVSYLIDRGVLTKEIAPSYFVQCLIYNTPNNLFGQNYQTTIVDVLNYLSTANLEIFKCQNERHNLFDTGDTFWNTTDARTTINALIHLWNDGML